MPCGFYAQGIGRTMNRMTKKHSHTQGTLSTYECEYIKSPANVKGFELNLLNRLVVDGGQAPINEAMKTGARGRGHVFKRLKDAGFVASDEEVRLRRLQVSGAPLVTGFAKGDKGSWLHDQNL